VPTPRLQRERQTIAAMCRIYCRHHHGGGNPLCAECAADLDYCFRRLDKCPYGAEKPTCKQCPTHCYSARMREKTRAIMRFAGPRMPLHHPWLSLRHWLDRLKKPAAPPAR